MADLEQLIKHLEMTSGGADGDEVRGALVSRKLLVPGWAGQGPAEPEGAGVAKLTMSITRRKST